MTLDPPEKTLAHAIAQAMAKHQGRTQPRKLRKQKDYERLGREVLEAISDKQT